MAITGTFNGADIVAWPERPGIKQIERLATDTVSSSTSPYTRTQQQQWWPGGDYWAWNVSMPQMRLCDAPTWEAFLMQLRGMKNVFLLGHPQRRVPRGVAKGLPLVSGLNKAMSTTLVIKGLTPNVRGQLMPEDHLQVGYRLHSLMDQADSDADGNATLNIWPSLREDVADGTPIILHCPKGIFRLSENQRSSTSNETRLTALKVLKCIEAR